MKNSKKFALVATLFVFVLTSGLAVAQPPQDVPKDNGQKKRPLFHCLQIVNPSEDQQAQIKGILEAAQPTLQAYREEIREQKEALRALFEAEVVDQCAVGGAIVAIRSIEEELRAETEKVMANIKLVLTPDQVARFEGCLAAFRDGKPGQGGGNGQGNGPGGN